jgi:hypothetical protein
MVPLKRIVALFSARLAQIPDIEHRPVEQTSVSAFLVLSHPTGYLQTCLDGVHIEMSTNG